LAIPEATRRPPRSITRAQLRGPATGATRRRGRAPRAPRKHRELLLADIAAEDQRHRQRERRREVQQARVAPRQGLGDHPRCHQQREGEQDQAIAARDHRAEQYV
jgi:hypothetical protein